jgi:hypothetical protein
MKYWSIIDFGYPYKDTLTLIDPNLNDIDISSNIISIQKADMEDGFMVREECDSYFAEFYTKEQLLEAIEELKQWVEKQ